MDDDDPAERRDQGCDAHQLAWRARRPAEDLQGAERQRTARRYPWLIHRPPYGTLLADRGVRLRLPDALAHAGRLHDPIGRRPYGAGTVRAARDLGAARAQGARAVHAGRPAVFLLG